MEGYSVKINFVSKDISAKEKVMLKDTTNAISLDTATDGSTYKFEPDYYAELSVHNEKSEDKDYKKYVIVTKSGEKITTGSESFMSTFKDIVSEMSECNEPYAIEAYRMPSRNYKGKEFITCSII